MAGIKGIEGIGETYGDKLGALGIRTKAALLEAGATRKGRVELANRKAENLVEKMKAVNAERRLVRLLPALSKVRGWIAQAKELPRKVTC